MPPYSFILNGNFVDILRNQFQESLATIPSQDTRVEREQWGIDWWIYHEGHHLRHCRADYFFRSPTERAIIRQVCAAKEKSLVYYLSVLDSFSKNIGMSLLWGISSQRWRETWDEKEVFVGEGSRCVMPRWVLKINIHSLLLQLSFSSRTFPTLQSPTWASI